MTSSLVIQPASSSLLEALDEGRRTGLSTGVLQASEAGQSLYEKLGFGACCRYAEYQ